MGKVTVINGLPREKIVLKEGNGGIYRTVKEIPAGHHYFVNVESAETYREFLCVESETKLQLILTSDDLFDIKEVRITGYNVSKTALEYTIIPKTDKGIPSLLTSFYKKMTTIFSKTTPLQQGTPLQEASPPPQAAQPQEATPQQQATPSQEAEDQATRPAS